jgi:hypothetical protein
VTATNVTVAPVQFDFGRVITRTLGVFGRNFPVFLFLAAIDVVPSAFLLWIWIKSILPGIDRVSVSSALLSSLPLLILAAVVSVVLDSLFQAAISFGAIVALSGKSASVGRCLSASFHSMLPLIAIGFVLIVGVVFGLVLLIVPGIILATMWRVAIPVRVVERTSIGDSFRRSAELTCGHRWAIFGLGVIFGLAGGAVGYALRRILALSLIPMVHHGVLAFAPIEIFWIGDSVLRIVTTSIGAVGTASIYYELRLIRDGMAPEQVEAVFA